MIEGESERKKKGSSEQDSDTEGRQTESKMTGPRYTQAKMKKLLKADFK